MARNRLKDLRRRVYHVLEQGPVGDRVSKVVDRFLVVLILINLIAVALESIPEYKRVTGPHLRLLSFSRWWFSRSNTACAYGARSSMARISICPPHRHDSNMC